MKYLIDTTAASIEIDDGGGSRTIPLYSDEAFAEIAALYVKVGWNQKYSYTFTWMGRPVIQLPDDMIRVQELIHTLRPDVIVETGVAHGGSLVFYASLCEAMGAGIVVGVDIEIREKNRAAIESHELASRIHLIEGSSTDPAVLEQVRAFTRGRGTVLVLLDSNHSAAHVAAELDAYAPLVTPGSYIVATDGIMREVADTPRGHPSWLDDNPSTAVEAFVARHPEFELADPPFGFNESGLSRPLVTHWPRAHLRRR